MLCDFSINTFMDMQDPAQFPPPTTPVDTFNPSALNLNQWAQTVSDAKMQYAVGIAKFEGGFCLWNTATTVYGINTTTWYANNGHPDVIGLFVTAMRAKGIKPVIYFGIRDTWFQTNNPGYTQAQYKSYVQSQLTELLTNYGAITAFYLDSAEWVFGNAYPWDSPQERKAFFKSIQPDCLVNDNSHTGTLVDSEVIEYELDTGPGGVPNGNVTPAEESQPIRADFEWFYNTAAHSLRTSSYMIGEIARTKAANCAYLTGVTIDPTGNVPAEQVTLLNTVAAGLP